MKTNLEYDEDQVQQAITAIRSEGGKPSTSFLQRRLRWGYVRAALILQELEQRGIVSPMVDGKPRELLEPQASARTK